MVAVLLEILGCSELHSKSNQTTGTTVRFDLRVQLKVSKTQLRTRGFQSDLVSEVLFHVLEYLAAFAGSVAFPEISLPVLSVLRKHLKQTEIAR